MHIPKSGGSSVRAALEAALPAGSIAPRRSDRSAFADFRDFRLLRQEARAWVALTCDEVQALGQYRVVSGHFWLATLLQIADGSSIATVLREPKARLLSLYTYWRVPAIGDFWAPSKTLRHAQRPLAEFLAEPRLATAIDNQVCRMLVHSDPRLPESDFMRASDTQSIAADAIEQLEALAFVGVLELGDSVWQGLTQLFEVKLNPTRVNVTGEFSVLEDAAAVVGEPVTAEAIDLMEQRSAADLLVYDHVLTRAGLDAGERQRLKDEAFVQQVMRFRSAIGPNRLDTN